MPMFSRLQKSFLLVLLDDDERRKTQLFYLELLLGSICALMSLINVATNKSALLISTFTTCLVSFANAFIISKSGKTSNVSYIIFTIKVLAVLTYFIISGGTEAFSPIWILLIPACGMVTFGRKWGTMLTLVMFLELIFFFYVPFGRDLLQCHYTYSFILRFPVVYVCFYAIGYYLEFVREVHYSEVDKLRREASFQSVHDPLTGLHNRLGFNRELDETIGNVWSDEAFSMLIADADYFKDINDNYGHGIGDQVLKTIASRMLEAVEGWGIVCRWGGEEFSVLLKGTTVETTKDLAEKIRRSVEKPMVFGDVTVNITVSIGGVCSKELSYATAREMVLMADKRLYKAKEQGRNVCVCGK